MEGAAVLSRVITPRADSCIRRTSQPKRGPIMSIIEQLVEPDPPPDILDSEDAGSSGATNVVEITYRYERLEPMFGSFKLYTRNGENCFAHINGGGLVALTALVQHSVFVAEGAAVLGHSVVRDEVRLEDHAVIEGNAHVSGRSKLRHESRVSGNAVLEGRVTMYRHAHVGENAYLRGMISLDYFAFVGDESRLFGNMHLE